MSQTSSEKRKIQIDFSQGDYPASVKNFMPDVYRDGDNFISILGVGEAAVTGEGSSVEESLRSWDQAFQSKAKK